MAEARSCLGTRDKRVSRVLLRLGLVLMCVVAVGYNRSTHGARAKAGSGQQRSGSWTGSSEKSRRLVVLVEPQGGTSPRR
jgi:hypothetical protein